MLAGAAPPNYGGEVMLPLRHRDRHSFVIHQNSRSKAASSKAATQAETQVVSPVICYDSGCAALLLTVPTVYAQGENIRRLLAAAAVVDTMASSNPSSTTGKSTLKTSVPSVHASSAASKQPGPCVNRSYTGKKNPDPRHLAIALHHAHNIQARKDTEATILSRIESLIDFPPSDTADASNPSSEDVETFKSSLRPFQPSDYDNLILERNIDGRCGYALCGNEHRKEDSKAKMRILWGPKGSGPGGRGKEMKIVPKEKLEMWCSDDCAERALYIRVQLSETPAWERTDKGNVDIKLLEEARESRREQNQGTEDVERQMENLAIEHPHSSDPDQLAKALHKLNVDGAPSATTPAERLALERGDAIGEQTRNTGLGGIAILEKDIHDPKHAPAPTPDVHTARGGSVEGFYPKVNSARTEDEDGEDDILPCI